MFAFPMIFISLYLGQMSNIPPKNPRKEQDTTNFSFCPGYHKIGRGKRIVHNVAFIEMALLATEITRERFSSMFWSLVFFSFFMVSVNCTASAFQR
jgi:hypothetical protein